MPAFRRKFFARRKATKRQAKTTNANPTRRIGSFQQTSNLVNKAALRAPGWSQITSWDPFPLRYNAKLTYSQWGSYGNGVATTYGTENVFRLNSLFDPDLTGVGHQPYGFDQLATLYREYKVMGVTVRIEANDPSNDGAIVGALITPQGDPTTLVGASINQMHEKPWFSGLDINDSGSQRRVLTQYFAMEDLIGCTKLQFDSDSALYSALTNQNPQTGAFLHVALAEYTGGIPAFTVCRITVTLTYHCMFWNRVVLAQS